MKADNLNNWDALELARILAERYLDAEDLVEAIPAAEHVGTYETEVLPEFIENNWRWILGCFDKGDLSWWVDAAEAEEELERERDEYEMAEHEYCEAMEAGFINDILSNAGILKYRDIVTTSHNHRHSLRYRN